MNSMSKSQGDAGISSDQNATITLFHDCSVVYVEKRRVQGFIYGHLKETIDLSKVGLITDEYPNAYAWLLANLYRVAGIQLYNDFEIRINIIPAETNFEKRCIFLREANLIDTHFNIELYCLLMQFIYGKVSKNVC